MRKRLLRFMAVFVGVLLLPNSAALAKTVKIRVQAVVPTKANECPRFNSAAGGPGSPRLVQETHQQHG